MPITMGVTHISLPANRTSKFAPLYLLVVAIGRIESDGTSLSAVPARAGFLTQMPPRLPVYGCNQQ